MGRAGVAFGAAALAVVLVPCIALAGIGDLDPSFGSGGQTVTDLGGTETGTSAALQSDGKIIVAGYNAAGVVVARYTANGALDVEGPDPMVEPGFGPDGDGFIAFSWAGAGDQTNAVAVQGDNKIVVAGTSAGDIAIARLNGNGTLDDGGDGPGGAPGFGVDGKRVTDFGGADSANAIGVQADTIVVAGTTGGDFAVARYDDQGALDSTFDGDGKATTDFGGTDSANAIAFQSGFVGSGIVVGGRSGGDFALARYNTANPSLDPGFGTGGKVTTDFGGTDELHALAVQGDDNIVAAGRTSTGGVNQGDFALARYNALNGALDSPAFSGDGKQTTDFGGGDDTAFGVAIQTDGAINAVGSTSAGTNPANAAVAQYISSGPLAAPTFSGDGLATVDTGSSNDAQAIAMQAARRIVIAGTSGSDLALARLFGADDGTDTDEDGITDAFDNCPTITNFDQANYDGDAPGDACDSDDDNDTVADDSDGCPTGDTGWVSTGATDNDHDGCRDAGAEDGDDDNDTIADGPDNCALTANADQANNDGDGQGDACDSDDDNDTIADGPDNCALTANADQANNDGDGQGDACDSDDDNDTIADGPDNCALNANADQANNDGDGQGDTCDSDDDNDGVADADDACPAIAAPTANGCPAAAPPGPTSSPRDLSLSHAGKKFKGTLTADVQACAQGQAVKIFHKVKGADDRIGTATTGSDGAYKLKKKQAPDGKYYASAPQSSAAGVTCLAAKSGSVKLG